MFRSSPLKTVGLLSRRRGLTLIELLVVLAILATLGAMVIPMIQNATRPARFASASDTIHELVKSLNSHATLSGGRYPNRFDSLQSASGTAYTKPAHALARRQAAVGAPSDYRYLHGQALHVAEEGRHHRSDVSRGE
ncbi:MAG: type II secretion system protein [Pirellulales bacterium]